MVYEAKVLSYSVKRRYKPDFILPNGIHVEAKGYLCRDDITKLPLVKAQNPGIDIRIVFQDATKVVTRSKASTTYADWADKHGFPWATGGVIPDDWWKE